MTRLRRLTRFSTALAALAFAPALSARDSLSQDDLKLLLDPGGWEFITITDSDSGIQTQHTCFDGQPHPQECSGTLTLHPDNTFTQRVHIHGQTVARQGKYELDGSQISFFDEFGNRDGPYRLTLDAHAKRLTLEMPQVRDELVLEKEYKRQRLAAQSAH
jgi:hypothetical protein